MPGFTEEFISNRLAEALRETPVASYFSAIFPNAARPAAVLIPFICAKTEVEDSEWQLLFTRRTDTVAEHRGQVAFPGGQAEPTDASPEMTALREAREEIGMDPLKVKILGKMDSLLTITNYLVTPIVGVIPWPYPIQLEPSEVSRAFTIPLDWLADPANHEIRYRTIPEPYAQLLHQETHPVIYFHPHQGELLWGVSAEITIRLINILYNKKLAGI